MLKSRRRQAGQTIGEVRTEEAKIPETWKANLRAIADAPLASLPLTAFPHPGATGAMERAGLIEVWRNRRQIETCWVERIRPGADGKSNGKGAKRIKVRGHRTRKLEPTATLTTWTAWCLGLGLDEVWSTERKDAKEEAATTGLELCRDEPAVKWEATRDGMPADGPKGLETVAGTARDDEGTNTPEIIPHPGIPQTGSRQVVLTLGGGSVEVNVRG